MNRLKFLKFLGLGASLPLVRNITPNIEAKPENIIPVPNSKTFNMIECSGLVPGECLGRSPCSGIFFPESRCQLANH